jgi:hypothetical protein
MHRRPDQRRAPHEARDRYRVNPIVREAAAGLELVWLTTSRPARLLSLFGSNKIHERFGDISIVRTLVAGGGAEA